LTPAKELSAALGGTFVYDSATTSGILRQGENELAFSLDSAVAKLNGKYVQAPAPLKVINNRFMIPAQFVAEKFGAEVYMRASKNTLMIFQPVDGKIVYQVVSGDTLWIVSQLFGTSVSSIKQMNNLTGDMIIIGQKLIIKNYTSVSSIIPQSELAAANGLTLSSVLYIGQALKIPVHSIAVKSTPGAQYGEVLDWFKEAQYVFPIGKTGRFIDAATGKSFMAQRTMGASHSDTETLTSQDSDMMKEIFGGSWNWSRRSFILEVDGRRFAVSVAGMPHAGVDGAPYLQNVSGRSDNWGYGPNYDRIPGNGMNGHFDVYFLNCLRHNDNQIDPLHQFSVLVSGGLQ
ncbi:MAG TPA: LysM peptidoglycan-binding domain-containing protein, partial [Ruminiclostridium sp.]|nr:LysM peptidoglycan-binding domain-containing protein [Ruminiclostridium sp.]